MRLLTFSTLYPDAARPRHGIFVENRLRQLLADGDVSSKVIAPVPWFPFTQERFGEYAVYAQVPHQEIRHGISVFHPRYPLIPKIGMTLTPFLLAMAAKPALKRMIKQGDDFDLIDAHYFYPDGVAAVMLGRALQKPVVITARGTDLNLIPQYPLPRYMIQWAASKAAGMITVCQALKDVLLELGVPDERVTVLRNGVDLQMFQPPSARGQLQRDLGLAGKTILSVGHLIERKGHDLVIKALARLPDVTLLIAGDGLEESNLRTLAQNLGVSERVIFLGAVSHAELRDYYAAVDILVLASSREGWANVLLESMACGTPVVATRVWGTPEVVAVPEAGLLVEERTPQAIAQAVEQLFLAYPDRAATRLYAEGFSWDDTTQGQKEIFSQILQGHPS